MKVAGSTVSWRSQRQSVVALSSTEAEYIGLTNACKEVTWLRMLLQDLGFPQKETILHSDNQSAIALAKNPAYHDRTKHIATRFHFVRDKVSSGEVKLVYCPTDKMIADGFTKAQGSIKYKEFKEGVGVEA